MAAKYVREAGTRGQFEQAESFHEDLKETIQVSIEANTMRLIGSNKELHAAGMWEAEQSRTQAREDHLEKVGAMSALQETTERGNETVIRSLKITNDNLEDLGDSIRALGCSLSNTLERSNAIKEEGNQIARMQLEAAQNPKLNKALEAFRHAIHCYRNGWMQDALSSVDEAICFIGTLWSFHRLRGEILMGLPEQTSASDLSAARQAFASVMYYSANDRIVQGNAKLATAECFFREGNFSECVKAAREARVLLPGASGPSMLAARGLAMMGERQGIFDDLTEAFRLRPRATIAAAIDPAFGECRDIVRVAIAAVRESALNALQQRVKAALEARGTAFETHVGLKAHPVVRRWQSILMGAEGLGLLDLIKVDVADGERTLDAAIANAQIEARFAKEVTQAVEGLRAGLVSAMAELKAADANAWVTPSAAWRNEVRQGFARLPNFQLIDAETLLSWAGWAKNALTSLSGTATTEIQQLERRRAQVITEQEDAKKREQSSAVGIAVLSPIAGICASCIGGIWFSVDAHEFEGWAFLAFGLFGGALPFGIRLMSADSTTPPNTIEVTGQLESIRATVVRLDRCAYALGNCINHVRNTRPSIEEGPKRSEPMGLARRHR